MSELFPFIQNLQIFESFNKYEAWHEAEGGKAHDHFQKMHIWDSLILSCMQQKHLNDLRKLYLNKNTPGVKKERPRTKKALAC